MTPSSPSTARCTRRYLGSSLTLPRPPTPLPAVSTDRNVRYGSSGVIELLPAVPPELVTGSVAGIVARPGIEVSIAWAPDTAGEIALTEATFSAVRAPGHARHRVAWNGCEVSVDLARFETVTLRGSDFSD